MKLLYITVSMPFGTAEEFLIIELKELIRNNIDVLLVPRSPSGPVINRDAKELVQHSVCKPLFSSDIMCEAIRQFIKNPKTCWHIIRIMFNSISIKTLAKNITILPKSLWLAHFAITMEVHHIHAQWGLTTATMAMIVSAVSNITWSFTAHRGDIAANNLLETKIRSAVFTRFISKNGMEMASLICKNPIKSKMFLIHMGVDLPNPSIPDPSIISTSLQVVLCPASFYPVKGHKYLLEAVSILKNRNIDLELWLAGMGFLKRNLQGLSESLGIADMVKFMGQLPHDKLLELYRTNRVSMVVLASIDQGNNEHEGIPVSLMEAMSYQIPVISTATGGIPELLADGAGIITQPKDPVALADAIETLIRNPEMRKSYGIAGQQRISEEFNVEKTVSQLIHLIESNIACRPMT